MVVKTKNRTREHKRLGRHQKHTKSFLKVYSPYLPLLVMLGFIFVSALWRPLAGKQTLAYATSLSSSDLLSYTNSYRSKTNEPQLYLNSQLSQAAEAKAKDMASRNYWSHSTPDGQEPWTFINQTGYNYSKAGENLAYGFASSGDVVAGWMNSAEHRANMLDKSFIQVGFGFVNAPDYMHSGPRTIVVALYAAPAGIPINDSSVKAINTVQPLMEPASTKVSWLQVATGGQAPWVMYAVGIFTGAGIAYLLAKHSLALRRKLRHGERFIVKHPLFDTYLLAFMTLCIVLSRSAGIIR